MVFRLGILIVLISVTLGDFSALKYDNTNDVKYFYKCEQGFEKIGTKCYHFSQTKRNWFQAYDGCSNVGRSNLTVLTEKKDMRALEMYFGKNRSRTAGHDKTSYWVASIKDWKQNKWIWYTSGRSVKFPDAVADDPINREWVCLAIDGVTKRWTAQKCFEPHYYVCQSDPVASVIFNICDNKKCSKNFRDKRISIDKCMNPDRLAAMTEKQKQRCQNLLRKSKMSFPGGIFGNQEVFDPKVPAAVIKRDKAPSAKKKRNKHDGDNDLMVCPYNWILLGRKCYKFSSEAKTWNEAYDACRKGKSKLATIRSRGQDNLIKMYLNGFKDQPQGRWISGRFNNMKNEWIWAQSGEVLKYQGFVEHALRNMTDMSQWEAITMDPKYNYEWSFSDVMEKKQYICQVNGKTVKQLSSPKKPHATIVIEGKRK